ncbi:MAG: CPBP family intramembrane metalloprotease [Oscillospiraceae bacterium]|nr:CPBP family intramembrane metalloprotease [Oscillospiraceae bacterium]
MNEDMNVYGENFENTEDVKPSILPDFKRVCVRVGIMMIVVYAARFLCNVVIVLASPLLVRCSSTMLTLLNSLFSIVFLNVIPITAAVFLLKFPRSGVKDTIFAKPKYFGRALGIFPAGYGAAMAMQMFTLLLARLFAGTAVEDSFNATENMFTSSNMTSAAILFVHTVILAPLFEEFWFRGLVLQSLRPYGNGFAIFVSAVLFGLTHANLAQFFYATVLGIVLGYVAVQTESVVTTMVLHAMFNGIAGISSLFMANPDITQFLLSGASDMENVSPVVTVFVVWLLLVVGLAVVGFIMAVVKLVHIKRYSVPKMQTELSAASRWGIFLSRPAVVIMLLMAADTMTVAFVTNKLVELIFFGV